MRSQEDADTGRSPQRSPDAPGTHVKLFGRRLGDERLSPACWLLRAVILRRCPSLNVIVDRDSHRDASHLAALEKLSASESPVPREICSLLVEREEEGKVARREGRNCIVLDFASLQNVEKLHLSSPSRNLVYRKK